MAKNEFRKLVKFTYLDTKYQWFLNDNNKSAFLVVDENGNYHYPELNRLLEISYLLSKDPEIMEIKKDKVKKFSFLPKVKYAGVLTLLSVSLLASCGRKPEVETPNVSSITQDEVVEEVKENISEEEIQRKYLSLLAPADDEIDFRYASDYDYNQLIDKQYGRDASSYEQIFGYSMPTEAELYAAVDRNPNIDQKYKDFIKEYIHDWLTLWPESDFSPFLYNLETLEIVELSKGEMLKASLATNVAAQYLRSENRIQVLEGIDLSKESDDYIVMAHELTHCARNVRVRGTSNQIEVSFYENSSCGSYADEAIITDLVYEMQGLGNKSTNYVLQSSYFRIILDCIGYTGSDYMNHSVNYLMEKMDEYMNEGQYAYHIIPMIDAEGSLHYTDYMHVDFYEFDELYKYLTRMYCNKYLTEGMTQEEANQVLENLEAEILFYQDKMAHPYDINIDAIEEQFKECCQDLGISFTRSR